MMGCCCCAMQRFRFEDKTLDSDRLQKVIRPPSETEKDVVAHWKQEATDCKCMCHVDGEHIVMC